jgi:hypothetical protein
MNLKSKFLKFSTQKAKAYVNGGAGKVTVVQMQSVEVVDEGGGEARGTRVDDNVCVVGTGWSRRLIGVAETRVLGEAQPGEGAHNQGQCQKREREYNLFVFN